MLLLLFLLRGPRVTECLLAARRVPAANHGAIMVSLSILMCRAGPSTPLLGAHHPRPKVSPCDRSLSCWLSRKATDLKRPYLR